MASESKQHECTARDASHFATTHWSVVLNSTSTDADVASQALEQLCATYYHPLYAFVRRHGHNPAEAQDLTQEFFHRFLSGDHLTSVAPEKGRFRSYLLVSLKHFLSVARAHDRALKRGGRCSFVPLDQVVLEEGCSSEAAQALPPDAMYDLGWATALMRGALNRLRKEYQTEGKMEQFQALKPFLSHEAGEGEYAVISEGMHMTPGAFSVAVHRFRQRYGRTVRAEVARTVAGPEAIDEELRYLYTVITTQC